MACWKGYQQIGMKMKGGRPVPNCVPMKEGGSEDHEVSMAQNALSDIISSASKLQNMLGTDEINIPGWIQDHISQAQNFISQAATNYHKLEDEDCDDCSRDADEYDVENHDDVANFTAFIKEYVSHLQEGMNEAEYQGRKVKLGKPFLTPDGPKKRSVYVKNPKGNVVKVNFGDKNMKIKKNIPGRRKNFRARHNCSNPGPRHKARYWSCRAW
jgi:hypothetical protein